MAVEVNSERKGVEITWNDIPESGPPDIESPPDFPDHQPPAWGEPHPEHPIAGDHPDHDLPGDQPRPEHPIVIPPDLEEGLTDEQLEKLRSFLEGNLPPYEGGIPQPTPISGGKGGKQKAVQVFGQGQEGDWSNTAVMPNDGKCSLSYPKGFTGQSYIEVRGLDGSLVDSGTIQVGEAQE